jgi:hypothetical protein
MTKVSARHFTEMELLVTLSATEQLDSRSFARLDVRACSHAIRRREKSSKSKWISDDKFIQQLSGLISKASGSDGCSRSSDPALAAFDHFSERWASTTTSTCGFVIQCSGSI